MVVEILKKIGLVLLGIVIAVAVFCAVVGIASLVNDISFGNQIVEWFGTAKEVVEELPTEDFVETAKILFVA